MFSIFNSPFNTHWLGHDEKYDALGIHQPFEMMIKVEGLWGYPLVNVYMLRTGKSSFFHGKLTVSTGPFSSSQAVNVYQAGYPYLPIQFIDLETGFNAIFHHHIPWYFPWNNQW